MSNEQPTLSEFAEAVGLSVSSAHRHRQSGLLADGATLAEWVRAYCAHLREVASGRGGDDQGELTRQRARQAAADADLKQLQLRERRREVVDVSDLKASLIAWIVGIRTAVLDGTAKLVAEIERRHNVQVDPLLVDDSTTATLDAVADYPHRGPASIEPPAG